MAVKQSAWSHGDGNTITVEHISWKPKKITGSRLGAVLGINHWKTPFQAWCEITRVAEAPFIDTKYTRAGQVIEPKLIAWSRENICPDILVPEDVYGKDFFKKTYGDFFPDNPIFGGMWDGIAVVGENWSAVIEAKTTSRPQDWEDGVPLHYAVQGLMYAYNLGLTDVYFPVAFLSPEDYDHPEDFVCTDENTVFFHLTVDDEFINAMKYAIDWWNEFVYDGAMSPEYDIKKDKTYLDIIYTEKIDSTKPDDFAGRAIPDIVRDLKSVTQTIKDIRNDMGLDALETDAEQFTNELKEAMSVRMSDEVHCVEYENWSLTKRIRKSIDKESLKRDNLFDKYTKESVYYTLKEKE